MTRAIDETQVQALISMPEAIEALREAYAAFALGEAIESPRSNLLVPPDGFIRTMGAALPNRGMAGYKELHRFAGRGCVTFHLFDIESGEQLAMIAANHLTALRTGACGGLAADLLAAPDSEVLAVIGSGAEARSQIAAVRAVRPIRRIQVYSRTAERRERLCAELEDIDAVPYETIDDALVGAQIIVVATHSTGGLALAGEALRIPGVHINSIGSTLPAQREIDPEVFRRSDRVIFDAEVALSESGDALAAREVGALDPRDAILLGDVVVGKAAGREGPEQRTLYKSVGSAIQDIALAVAVYDRAAADFDGYLEIPEFRSLVVVDR